MNFEISLADTQWCPPLSWRPCPRCIRCINGHASSNKKGRMRSWPVKSSTPTIAARTINTGLPRSQRPLSITWAWFMTPPRSPACALLPDTRLHDYLVVTYSRRSSIADTLRPCWN